MMRFFQLFALCCLVGSAWAQDAGDARPSARWLVRPTGELFEQFFPPIAMDQRVEGRVVLLCAVRVDERADCAAESEEPAGWGFGEAAVAASRSFRLALGRRDGVPIPGARVRQAVVFSLSRDRHPDAGELDLPSWDAAPNADAVAAAWPEGASQPGLRGRGVLSCRVKADRMLDCTIARESRSGLGLGAAAMRLAPSFRVSTRSEEFAERYRAQPFLLPINFGFSEEFEPLSIHTTGAEAVRAPSPPEEIVDAIYPAEARTRGVAGSVVIRCTTNAELTFDCATHQEQPSGHGFGDAALTLSRSFFEFAAAQRPSPMLEGDIVEMEVRFNPGR